MAICGYRRISPATQSMQRQDLDGCDKVFEEAVTGAKRERPQLNAMLDWIREGDEVRVHSIDRLARDLRDLQSIVSTIVDKGAQITFIKEQLMKTTSTASYNCISWVRLLSLNVLSSKSANERV